jgi:hypothetical protein
VRCDVRHPPAHARRAEAPPLARKCHPHLVPTLAAREPQRKYSSNSRTTNRGRPPASSARARKSGQCSRTSACSSVSSGRRRAYLSERSGSQHSRPAVLRTPRHRCASFTDACACLDRISPPRRQRRMVKSSSPGGAPFQDSGASPLSQWMRSTTGDRRPNPPPSSISVDR